MLRRRHKTPKVAKHAAHAPHAAPRGRRRARADTPVPVELVISPAAKHEDRREPEPPPRPERPKPEPAKREPPKHSRSREGVVLVTGFEPFGGETTNPSWDICNRLPRMIAGMRVETCRVPCEFRRAIEVVADAIERHRPSLVICIGQAGGRTHVSLERVAINVDDARIADNAGVKPVDEPIALNGPPAYFATLPVKAMTAAMRAAGTPAEVSNTAGTYVCNHLMYGVLHFLAGSGSTARAGFIHVPYAEDQVLDKLDKPALALATMAKGIEAAVAAAVQHENDIVASEGKLD